MERTQESKNQEIKHFLNRIEKIIIRFIKLNRISFIFVHFIILLYKFNNILSYRILCSVSLKIIHFASFIIFAGVILNGVYNFSKLYIFFLFLMLTVFIQLLQASIQKIITQNEKNIEGIVVFA